MHLKHLIVKNFRALEDVECEFSPGVSVIVGPNASGKTTVLEAIKLAKALIAPRTQTESQQSLFALNASAPHSPQQLIPAAIGRDPSKPVLIKCAYSLNAAEVNHIEQHHDQIVTNLLQVRLGQAINISNFAAYVSSPLGQSQLQQVGLEVSQGIKQLRDGGNICRVEINIDFTTGRLDTPFPVFAALFSFLDSSLPPNITKFTYFPADRALPRGEQPVQLGVQDAQTQLESHNSQPQLKYSRLKNLIFTSVISGDQERDNINKDFSDIFQVILKGRVLDGFGVNNFGQLMIRIREVETGRIFDIDAMSSGEKGLILTFLMISRTVADGGIVLLDEPELHLNPAVCKHMLDFIIEKYVKPRNMQFIVCSHSPEILAGAFSKEECALFHLRSSTLLTKVRSQDQEEVDDALKKLGTSDSEALLFKATIFVEGEQDVELLEAGFGTLFRNYMLKELGGRKEVEKQIRTLQGAENLGVTQPKRYFIFDKDEAPTNLKDSKYVKVLQWNKRCLENYLIDLDVLTDLLKQKDLTKSPVSNVGQVGQMLKRLALEQIKEFAAREIFAQYQFPSFNMRTADLMNRSIDEMGEALAGRLDAVKNSVGRLSTSEWQAEFEEKVRAREEELRIVWEEKWKDICDGKRLFKDLQREGKITISIDAFKRKVMVELRNQKGDTWRSAESLLSGLINDE